MSDVAGLSAGLLTGAQSAGTAVGQYQAAGATMASSDFASRLAALNAADAARRGDVNAQRTLAAGRRLIGSQRAAMGANGVALDSGSPLDVQAGTAELSALDAKTIQNNAAREAWGMTTEATLERLGAAGRARAQETAAFDTILTGAGKMYGLYAPDKPVSSRTGKMVTRGRAVNG